MRKPKEGHRRFTFDMPEKMHRKMKAIAALTGQRIPAMAYEFIKEKLDNDKELNLLLKKLCMFEDE